MKVSELEAARNDLHETNCKERSVVHELTLNNRQLQLSEAALSDRLSASDDQLRQLHSELDSSVQHVTQLESSLERSRDTERALTERCGELTAELADWKCRLDDALRLVDSKDSDWTTRQGLGLDDTLRLVDSKDSDWTTRQGLGLYDTLRLVDSKDSDWTTRQGLGLDDTLTVSYTHLTLPTIYSV